MCVRVCACVLLPGVNALGVEFEHDYTRLEAPLVGDRVGALLAVLTVYNICEDIRQREVRDTV